MALGSFQAGYNFKARINSAAFGVQSAQLQDVVPRQDVTNTEQIPGNPAAPALAQTIAVSAVGEACIPGTGHMEGNIRQACFDALNNLFAAPFNIIGGTWISARFYLNGTTGVSWYASSFYVERCSTNSDVRTLQPSDFSGYSDGYYTIPAT